MNIEPGWIFENGIGYRNTYRSDGTVLTAQERLDNSKRNGGTYRPDRYEGHLTGDPEFWAVVCPDGTMLRSVRPGSRPFTTAQETQAHVEELNRR